MSLQALPPDALRVTLFDVAPDEILRNCRTSRRFQEICKDDYFWKALVQRHYPEYIDDRSISDYKGLYLTLYGAYLQTLPEDRLLSKSHPRLIELDNERRQRRKQVHQRCDYRTCSNEDRVSITEELHQIEQAFSEQKAELYRALVTERIQRLIENPFRTRPVRYIPVNIGNQLNFKDHFMYYPEFLTEFIQTNRSNGDDDIRDGDLIGYYSDNMDVNEDLPLALLYIYRIGDRVSIDRWMGTFLPQSLLDTGLTYDEIVRKYDLPFDPDLTAEQLNGWAARRNAILELHPEQEGEPDNEEFEEFGEEIEDEPVNIFH